MMIQRSSSKGNDDYRCPLLPLALGSLIIYLLPRMFLTLYGAIYAAPSPFLVTIAGYYLSVTLIRICGHVCVATAKSISSI